MSILDLTSSFDEKRSKLTPSRLYFLLLCGVLFGYAVVGKGFAYLGVGPFYIGEITLLIGLLCLIFSGGDFGWIFRPTGVLLALFMLWGAARTFPYLDEYGFF